MTDPKAAEPTPTDPAIQSGSYALGALSAEERAAFEAHLAGSEDARTETTGLSDTAVLLGLAVPPVTPPPSLKASIMAQLDDTPQLPAVDAAPAPGPAELRARSRWSQRPLIALASAAAVLGLIAGGGIVATSLVQQGQYQQQAATIAEITAAADSQRRTVELPDGSATLVWSGELASSALIVDGLEPLPGHQVYELWYIGEDGARPAGTFTADGSQTSRVLEGDMRAGDVIGVTIEPRGGSEQPTTDPVLVIETA